MTKEIKNLILIYVLPVIAVSLFSVFFLPAFASRLVLGMVSGVALITIGMALLIDWFDKKG